MYHRSVHIPKADILVHAGDMTHHGRPHEIEDVARWFNSLVVEGVVDHVVVCPGNHELGLEHYPALANEFNPGNNVHLLWNSGVTLLGVSFWGIPQTLRFYDWAFNTDEAGIASALSVVPNGTDVLVAHGPPKGVRDMTTRGEAVGSVALYDWVLQEQPQLVVCGHIHGGHGTEKVGRTKVTNASTCTEHYQPTNPAVVTRVRRSSS